MDVQTLIVIAIVAVSVLYLTRKYFRAAKSAGDGCSSCGCEGQCPAEKRRRCDAGQKDKP